MLDTMRTFIMAHPILAASLSSLWGAIAIDLFAFVQAKAPGDFFGQFGWSVAGWRYLQALVAGFMGNAIVAGGASVVALTLWWFA